MPRVRALRDFISTVHGNVSTGDKFSMDDGKRYDTLKAMGYVEDVRPDPVFTEGVTDAPGARIPEDEEGRADQTKSVEPEPNVAPLVLALHHEGGPWFTVRDADGRPIHDGKLKKADAEALLADKAAT